MASLGHEDSASQHALDTIPEDRPSNEWMPRNISLQRWWDVMTMRTTTRSSSNAGSGGNSGGASVSIPSDEAEIVDRVEVREPAGQIAGTTTATATTSRRERQQCGASRRTNVSLALIALVIALMGGAVGIFFIVDSTRGGEPSGDMFYPPPADIPSSMSPPPSLSTYDAGSQTETDRVEIDTLVRSISGDSLEGNNSPQAMALTWLLDEDPAQVTIRDDGEDRVKQRYVLGVVFFALDGPAWNTTRYLTPSHECDWTGITCNDSDLDLILDLSRLGLNGSIPSEIAQLSYLEQLNLSNNSLNGNVPSDIWGLPFLYNIDLSENLITGTMASMSEWTDLPFLEYLYLQGNKLTSQIPELPDTVPPLKHLWLHDNALSGRIPPSLSNLVDLESIVAYGNKFNGTMDLDDWSSMTKLFYVDVSWNQLSGTFPRNMASATSLKFIYMNNNSMTGPLDENLGELHHLQEIWLHSNSFTGKIPSKWGDLENLSTLLLYENMLNGSVPEVLCNLTESGNLTVFETDCKENIVCSCCTACH